MKINQPLIPLNLQFFNESKRGEDIETRLNAIATELEEKGDNITVEELRTLTTEVDTLKAERKVLLESVSKRNSLLASIAEGRTGDATGGGGANIIGRISFNNGVVEDEADPYGTLEYRRSFMDHVLRGKAIPKEYRSGEITHTTDVGSVIPTPVLNKIIEEIESTGMILSLVTRTAHRGGLRIPTSSVKPVATWVAEGTGSDKQKKPTGEISFLYHKLRCAVAVTLEVDTMALPVFEATLVSNVVEAMVKALEQAIISGTGAGQPKGILSETPIGGQVIQVQNPSFNDVADAFAAVPMAYENNVRWCMTKKTYMEYASLQDANGQPIGMVDHGGVHGRPARVLWGIPVTLCDYMPSFAGDLPAGTVFAFLFNFKDYILNTNLNMGIKRYEDNETDDFITRAVMLADGKVVVPQSLVLLTKKS